MSFAMDESTTSRLDGRGSRVVRIESRNPVSGCETGRPISDKDDSRKRDSTTARCCESFHSKQI